MTTDTEFLAARVILDLIVPACLDYLDGLRESGETNMLGAVPYLQARFPGLTRKQAKGILLHWMRTFSERQSKSKGA